MNRVIAVIVFAFVPVVCVAPGFAGDAGQTEDRKLTASDADASDYFGVSVAVSGTIAVVGAFSDDHSGLLDTGSAYVFDRMTGQQVAKLTASDADQSDQFGYSVAVSGTTAVVGAPGANRISAGPAGSAYVFDLPGGQQVAELTASDADEGDWFGWSVAVSGTTAVVGAINDDHSGLTNAGSAYVFDLTTGQQVAKLISSDAGENDYFGWSVAVSGTTAVVGSPLDDHSGPTNAGSAYVFDLTTGQQVAKLTASDANQSDRFGDSVAVSGTTVVVGADKDNHSGIVDAGSAYVFDLTTGQQVAKLTASDAELNDDFGESVAVSGTTVVVGTRFNEHSGLTNPGSAYVFELSPCLADLAEPSGVLDLADIAAFVGAFLFQLDTADINNDAIWDLSDIAAFLNSFNAGCP